MEVSPALSGKTVPTPSVPMTDLAIRALASTFCQVGVCFFILSCKEQSLGKKKKDIEKFLNLSDS